MANKNYRYSYDPAASSAEIARYVPGATVPDTEQFVLYKDIVIDEANKGDLDAYMESLGFLYEGENPDTTPIQEATIINTQPHIVIDLASGATIVLTRPQYAHKILVLVSTFESQSVEFPQIDGLEWTVRNSDPVATAHLSVTGSVLGFISLGPLNTVRVWSDGVNLRASSAPVILP